ncbi:glycosyltransferase family 4 protein [Mucilaginibacter sp. L196]|uniref:glycosyltransferase family 4 protein n=1 Tax=Mucilaginibacter sp. L196 TaxID=1641870 RepID=UPI00131EBB0A|nr:glycosyltransferase [Mucilaginibacter sp. L196]
MKLIISHPTGNNNSRAVVYKLAQEGMLYEFHTSIASFPNSLLGRLQKIPFLAEFQRRNFEYKIKHHTKVWPLVEVGRMLSIKVGFKKLIKHEYGIFSVDAVYKSIDRHVASTLKKAAKHGVTGVYAYEDGALETFKQAKLLGLKCIYDLPIAYWEAGKKLMNEEAIRLPGWADTLGGGIHNSAAKYERKKQELELADLVIVPSHFVLESLPEWAKSKKIVMAPFGTPAIDNEKQQVDKGEQLSRQLRVLFVGSMSQRKGLGDLFTAVKMLNNPNIELVVMGEPQMPIDFYRNELPDFTHEQGRPNKEVLALMRTCDVFCLPSIVEGRALVMQEAMSQGLPLIITPNTGGEDLIIEGETGFLVPIRSPQIIAEKLKWFLDNYNELTEMSKKVKLQAAKYTWANYGKIVIESINELT